MRFVKNNEQVWVHTIVYGRNRANNTPVLFLCVDRQFSHPLFKLRDKAEALSHIFNKHNDQQNYFVYTVEYPIQRGVLRQVNNNTVSFDNFTYTDENNITFTFRSYQVNNDYKKKTTKFRKNTRWVTEQADNNNTYSLQRYWNIEMNYFDTAVDWWLPYTQTNKIEYGGIYVNKNENLVDNLNSLNYTELGSLIHRSDKELTIKNLNYNFLKDFQKVGKNDSLRITFFKQSGTEEQIYSVRDGEFNDVSSTKYPQEKTVKFELSYDNNVIFRYAQPFTYARIITIEKNNLNGGLNDGGNSLEYGIYINNGNINVNQKGITTLNHAKINGSAVFNDLQVEIPRRVILNFFDSNQRLIQYSGEWDLSGDLVLNTGCQGNCSGGCLGSCSINCGSNCSGGCTGCSSCGGCDSR